MFEYVADQYNCWLASFVYSQTLW